MQPLVITQVDSLYVAMLTDSHRRPQAIRALSARERIEGIYLARIQRVLPNLQAAFVEMGPEESAYLPLAERGGAAYMPKGQELLLVQVAKEASKDKHCVVKSGISLVKSHLALNFFPLGRESDRGELRFSYSAKLPKEFKAWLKIHMEAPLTTLYQGAASGRPQAELIFRTSLQERQKEEILLLLTAQWEELLAEMDQLLLWAKTRLCPGCLRPAPLPVDSLLAGFSPDEYTEIVTDLPSIYDYLGQTASGMAKRRLYNDETYALEKLYSLRLALDRAVEKRVWLPSGAYLLIEHTEALTVIDVNSGRNISKKGGERAFLDINLEAAKECGRQWRIRNLSGIILIDFINMPDETQKKGVAGFFGSISQKRPHALLCGRP